MENSLRSKRLQIAGSTGRDQVSRRIKYLTDHVGRGQFNMGGNGGGCGENQLEEVTIRMDNGIEGRVHQCGGPTADRNRWGIGKTGRVFRQMNVKGVGARPPP